MAELTSATSNKKFLKITGGEIREKVAEGTPGAQKYVWEAGGEKGEYWAKPYKEVTGKITNVTFHDGEHGGRKFSSLNIELDKIGDVTPVLTVGVESKYADDLMKKFPNVDFTDEVKIRPFDFIPDGEEKNKTGVTLLQHDGIGQFTKKIYNAFEKQVDGKWVTMHDFPTPQGDVAAYERDDWKIHFLNVRRFLVNYTKQHISTKFVQAPAPMPETEEVINPEDIPF